MLRLIFAVFIVSMATLAAGCGDDVDARDAWLANTLVDDNRDLIARDPVGTGEKFEKMASALYLFFRGTAVVYTRDTSEPGAAGYAPTAFGDASVGLVPLVGDPHPENIGTFRAADGTMLLGYNDFDGAVRGPYIHDVRRLALGFGVAAEEARQLGGLTDNNIRPIVEAVASGYAAEVASIHAGRPPVQVRAGEGYGVVVDDLVRRALRDGDAREALDEYTRVTDGRRTMFFGDVEAPAATFVTDRTIPVSAIERARVERAVEAWALTTSAPVDRGLTDVIDVSRRLGAGVSSYPVLRYYTLVEGPTDSTDDDRLLELKEIRDPVAFTGLPRFVEQEFAHNAARVVRFQRAMVERTGGDPLLGYANDGVLALRVRERTKYQKNFGFDRQAEKLAEGEWSPEDAIAFAELAGRMLAAAHHRGAQADGVDLAGRIQPLLDGRVDAFVAETTAHALASLERTIDDYARFVRLLDERGPLLGAPTTPSRP